MFRRAMYIPLAVLSITCLVATAATGAEVDEPGSYSDTAVETPGAGMEKSLACNPAGKYCYGMFDDLVYRVRFEGTGDAKIWLQPAAASAVQASGRCTLFGDVYVIAPASLPAQSRLLNRMDIARVMGDVFRMDINQGPSGYCELQRIYHPY